MWNWLGGRDNPSPERLKGTDAVNLRQVSKIYQSEAGDFAALKQVNLCVSYGEWITVVGKSGSGKSTLINMMTGIDRPTEGEVWMAGTPLHTLSENQAARWRGRNLGIVFQFFQLLPTLTVLDNVMLPMDFCDCYPARERSRKARELLARVGVEAQAGKLPSQLSGGQQQRVAIARALANQPPLLIADEPTGNLDGATTQVILELFGELTREGKTIILVTHDPDVARCGQRVITVREGSILSDTQGGQSYV